MALSIKTRVATGTRSDVSFGAHNYQLLGTNKHGTWHMELVKCDDLVTQQL